MSSSDRRESAALKSNTCLRQTVLEEVPADGVSIENLQAELDAAYVGVFADMLAVAGDRLSPDDLHDLNACLTDRLADIKFGHAALAAYEQSTVTDETRSNVVVLPLPATVVDRPAA